MPSRYLSRRNFIKGASALALSPLIASDLHAQTGLRQRLDWSSFRSTRDYSSLIDGIARMRANTNTNDKRSWNYWVNVHQNFCPHGLPYFLAWHRGFLYYFEQQLRSVAGNNNLVLPYWDYYTTPDIPSEFLNSASWNSLYQSRLNTNVASTLTLAPFGSSVTNMQRGLSNSFEASFESAPHDPVHNLIGNVMASMQSPTDPIFWLHHANVDRIWSAWEQAGGGRTVPPASDSYWNGTFTYATRLTMPRSQTINTRTNLNYFYQNEQMPASLPVARAKETTDIRLVSASSEDLKLAQLGPRTSGLRPRLLTRPGSVRFPYSAARAVGGNRRALGGVLNVPLNEASVSADLPIDTGAIQLLQGVVSGSRTSGVPYQSAQVVLDSVNLRSIGEQGGYFYRIYVNLPASTDVDAGASYQVGSIGAHEIASAEHRVHMGLEPAGTQPGTVRLVFPATRLLQNLPSGVTGGFTISFVRVSGDTSPSGDVINVGEARLELSMDPVL